MLRKVDRRVTVIRIFAVVLIFGVLFFGVIQMAYAILYSISVTDGSTAEWSTQSIPVFQTDDTGETGINPSEDIVQTWAASGTVSGSSDSALFFRMLVNSTTALGTSKAAIAAIDCNNNGDFFEAGDRLVVFIPQCGSIGFRSIVSRGDESAYFANGPTSAQRIGSELEWRVLVADLPPDAQDPAVDCRGTVGLKFYTADAQLYCQAPNLGPATLLDETNPSPFTGIRIPTAVEMDGFNVRDTFSTRYQSILLILAALGAGMSLVLLVIKRTRRS